MKNRPQSLDLASDLYKCYPCYVSVHDDVIKWKHFPRYWPFVRGIHRSPVNSPHKGQWRGALMFSLICVWIKGWVNNREAGDLRRHRGHYDVSVMLIHSMACKPGREFSFLHPPPPPPPEKSHPLHKEAITGPKKIGPVSTVSGQFWPSYGTLCLVYRALLTDIY